MDRKEVQSTTGITRLTAREYQIVCFLLQHTNTFHTASAIAEGIHTNELIDIAPHSIEQAIHTVRKKLQEPATNAQFLQNRHGFGYGICYETSPRNLEIAVTDSVDEIPSET